MVKGKKILRRVLLKIDLNHIKANAQRPVEGPKICSRCLAEAASFFGIDREAGPSEPAEIYGRKTACLDLNKDQKILCTCDDIDLFFAVPEASVQNMISVFGKITSGSLLPAQPERGSIARGHEESPRKRRKERRWMGHGPSLRRASICCGVP